MNLRCSLLLSFWLAAGCSAGGAALPGSGEGDDDDDGGSPTPISSPGDPRTGLNPGQPLDDIGGIHLEGERVHETGTGWVRVNFRLGPYESAEDPDWQAAYDEILEDYLARGLRVYGLIGGESVYSDGALGTDEWMDDYVVAFVKIVDLFKDRVRVFESFNEPNNWDETMQPQLAPDRFARLLERVYLETKFNAGHADDPAWQVTLVSGPLFSFDGQDASGYLDETYTAGRFAGAWDYSCSVTGRFPLDGIGYHVYVREDPDATEAEVRDALAANLAGALAVADAHEAAGCPGDPKTAWISEVGWNADYATEAIQARNIGPLFEAYGADPRVAVFFWFTLQDFPDGPYGLYRLDGTARPVLDAWSAAQSRRSRIPWLTMP